MAHPAERTRRMRARRRLVLLAMILAVAVAARALAMSGDGFPGHARPLRGAPVEMLVQDGARSADVRAVARGVRRADHFIRAALGRAVRGPVQVRVARGDPCPGGAGDRSVIGGGGAGGLCLDTVNLQWQWLARNHPGEAAAIAAHEYAHVLQAQLGCLPAGEDRDFRWLVEGMATHLGWEAMKRGGDVNDRDVRRAIRRDGAFERTNGPLRTYERAGGRTPQYARWHLAVRTLLALAVARRPALTVRPEASLIGFCEQVGAGRPWRAAFGASFGIPVFEFYAQFEAAWPRAR